MFLRARLKSAFAYAISVPSLIITGVTDFMAIPVFFTQYRDPSVSNNFYNLQFLEQVKSEPLCKPKYEIWETQYSHLAFTCNEGVDVKKFHEKFDYYAKEKGWQDWKNWASDNWVYYFILPAGIITLGFAVYGFIDAEPFIRIERNRQAARDAEIRLQAERQAQAMQREEIRRAEIMRQGEYKPIRKETEYKKMMKDASTQTEVQLLTQTAHSFFPSSQEAPPPYDLDQKLEEKFLPEMKKAN